MVDGAASLSKESKEESKDSSISFLIFSLVLTIAETEVLKSPTITLDLSIFPFIYKFLLHIVGCFVVWCTEM